MNYDEFVGQVQNRARLASKGEAVAAIRATLMTLTERLFGQEVEDLASQLPTEIAWYMRQVEEKEKFGLNEFFKRVTEREGVDYPEAVYHARVVMEVVGEAVSKGEIDDIRAQLPPEFSKLFEGSKTVKA